jgi:hypothetical protein
MERRSVQNKQSILVSLLAHSAITRVSIALLLIIVTWLGIQWAVALQ